MHCAYDSDQFDALYNLVVGINIMSKAFALKLFKKIGLNPHNKGHKGIFGAISPQSWNY